jgi:hypothetical protein
MSGWWLALMLATGSAQAVEVAGVQVPDSVRVGTTDLVLNGAGVRTRAVFKVYVGALYLTERKSAAPEALAQKGPKRVALHILRDLSAEQLSSALTESLSANLPDAEREKLAPQVAELTRTMEAVGSVKERNVVTIDYLPEVGTRVALDGAPRGKPIPGEDFHRALLRIWLGDKPVDRSLKAGMLGQGS